MKKAFYKKKESKITPYTPNEALALMVSADLTKHQYLVLRKGSLCKGVDLYPAYNKVKRAKHMCYPHESKIRISDISAEIELQEIVNLTLTRLMSVENVLANLPEQNINLILLCK
jgi:hypothetical protein